MTQTHGLANCNQSAAIRRIGISRSTLPAGSVRPATFSHHQLAGKNCVRYFAASEDSQDGFNKYAASLVNILAHCGQWRAAVGGKTYVVVTDYSNIGRHAQAKFLEC